MQLMNGHSGKVQDRVTGYLMKNPKASAKEIARAVGTTQSNVYNYTAKARKMVGTTTMPGKKGFWTPYALERLDYWRKTGKSFGQIAKLLSKELDARVSAGAVSGVVYRLKHKEEQKKAVKLGEEGVQLRLTRRQLIMAEMLGIPPEQYARELAKYHETFADTSFEFSQGRSTTPAPAPASAPAPAPAPASISVPDLTPIPASMLYQVGGDHYKDSPIQPWAAMEAWMGGEQFVGFLRGNVIKYVARCDKKGGVEDLKKARHYLTKLIEICGGESDARPDN